MMRCASCKPGTTSSSVAAVDGVAYCAAHWARRRERAPHDLGQPQGPLPRPRPPPSLLGKLYSDAIFSIFLHLDQYDLKVVGCVCSEWRRLAGEVGRRFSPAPRAMEVTTLWANRWNLTVSWPTTPSARDKETVVGWRLDAETPEGCSWSSSFDAATSSCTFDCRTLAELNRCTTLILTLHCFTKTGASSSVREIPMPSLSIMRNEKTVANGCLLGSARILLASGAALPVAQVQPGMRVKCGDAKVRVVLEVKADEAAWWGRHCLVDGVPLTRGHPVWRGDDWWRPDELQGAQEGQEGWQFEGRYNLLLRAEEKDASPLARSILALPPQETVAGVSPLLCSTLGSHCGRLAALRPDNHKRYCLDVLARIAEEKTLIPGGSAEA